MSASPAKKSVGVFTFDTSLIGELFQNASIGAFFCHGVPPNHVRRNDVLSVCPQSDVQFATPTPDADYARQREIVDAFLAAARAGDFDALVAVLDPDVVFRVDRGRLAARALPQVEGASEVAREILSRGTPFRDLARPAVVNGAAGLVVVAGRRTLAVVGFTVAQGRIREIDIVADPDKLGRLSPFRGGG